MALIAVFFPFSAVSSFPAEVMYQKPPIIRKSTAMPKAIPKSQLIIILKKPLKLVLLQLTPLSSLQLKAGKAKATIGSSITADTATISRVFTILILRTICFKLFTPFRV